ncbi:MAG: 30S ribosomal protein S1 [Candidatus Aureabacteria bacterium]|nr:30S ribosomal protein S1 [Candidatus Auribacterota bacterium]
MVFEDQLDASLLDKGMEERKKKEEQRAEMSKLYAESLKDIKAGKIVEGTIIRKGEGYVLVDIGYKSEGAIPIEEFTNRDMIKVGDKVQVYVESREDQDGTVVLSKAKADKMSHWEEAVNLCKEGKIVTGKIVRKVKGGMMVDIGLEAFLPASHVGLRHVKNLDGFLGKELEFKVIKINPDRRNVVLSRRALLEEERKHQREKVFATLKVGDIVEGMVKNITDFGAFVDLNGIDGLLHITDMSWGRVNHPSEICAVGDKIKVQVLEFDKERERISLGLKQLTPNPWSTIEERYPVGAKVKGRVVNIVPYGAFIELERGIEGLVHISELSWTRKVGHPSEVLGIGDTVQAMVLSIDKEAEKISLGLKQIEANPWTVAEEKYPVGTVVKARVRNIVPYGAFVELDEGIEALVHISDISWTRKLNHPSEVLKKGEIVETKVLSVDQENQKISLGIKQMKPNPWDDVDRRYRVGDAVSGTITNVTGFGLFVELEDGIEGLVHISQIPKRPEEDLKTRYKAGDRVKAKILRIDPEEGKIGLSIKEHMDDLERGQWSEATRETEVRAGRPEPDVINPVLSEDITLPPITESDQEKSKF